MTDDKLIILPAHEIEQGKKYVALKEELQNIVKTAKGHVVNSRPTLQKAAEYKTSLAALNKRFKEEYKATFDPMNKRKSQIMDLFKTLEALIKEAGDVLDDRMIKYRKKLKEEEEQRQKEEARLAEERRKRLEDEEAEKQKALDEAKTEEEVDAAVQELADTHTKIAKTYDAPAKDKVAPKISRTAGGGSVSFTSKWKCEVIDINLLPEEYIIKTANQKKLDAVVTAGVRSIPGTRIYEDFGTRTRAAKF